MQEALRPFAEFTWRFDETLKQFQAVLASVNKEISRFGAGLNEQLRPVFDRLQRYPGICIEYGWPPFDVPLSVIAKVVALYDEGGLSARPDVDALFVRVISKSAIRDVRDEWRECYLLHRRIHILDAAVGAHLKGEYVLSVPVLLASLEGVVADLHAHSGRMTQPDTRRFLAEIFSAPDGPVRWSTQLNDAARSVIVDAMVGGFVHGDPQPIDVRRNAVMHGADVAYGNEVYSLKAILMLDLVREQYGFVGLEESPVFHRQRCSTLRKSSRKGHHYKTAAEAEIDDRRPCSVCHPERVAD